MQGSGPSLNSRGGGGRLAAHTRPAHVEIETHSELTRGQTVADWNAAEPNARICLEVDAAALSEMFTDQLRRGLADKE